MAATVPASLPKVERSGNITIVTFTSDAIRNVENVIARELETIPGATGNQHLLLDFTNVEQLNSIELGTLIRLHKLAEQSGGRLTLFNLSARLFEIFTITRLDTLLGICRERVVDASGRTKREAQTTDEAGKGRGC
jgi:anti-anti-sigma factor